MLVYRQVKKLLHGFTVCQVQLKPCLANILMGGLMMDNDRYMIEGMDRLLKKFNKYPNSTLFTVEEIIKASNEVYDEIMKEDN